MNLDLKDYTLLVLLLLSQGLLAQITDTLAVVNIIENRVLYPSEAFDKVEIDSLDITDNIHDELSQLLSKHSSYYIKSNGPNSLATISVRGLSSSHTKVYWNSIPMTTPTLGVLDLSLIPAALFDNISLNPGSGGLNESSGTAGASVSLENNASYMSGYHMSFAMKSQALLSSKNYFLSNSFSNNSLSLESKIIYQSAENDFPYLDITSSDSLLRKRENSGLTRFGLVQNVFYRLNEHQELSFKVFYVNNDKEIPQPIGSSNNLQWQKDEIFKNLLTWKYNSSLMYHALGLAYSSDYSNYIDPTVFIDSKFDIKTISSYYNIGVKVNKNITISSRVNYDNYHVLSSGYDSSIYQDKLSVLTKLSYDKNRVGGVGISLREEIVDSEFKSLLPAVSFYYHPKRDKDVVLHANIAKNLRLPSLNDLYWKDGGNPELKNESTISSELGIEKKVNNWTMKTSAYFSLVDDWIQWLPNANSLWTPSNIKKVQSSGIEFRLNKLTSCKSGVKIEFKSSYRYNRSINIKVYDQAMGSEGLSLIYNPDHQFNIGLRLSKGVLAFQYSQSINSKVYIDPANTIYLPYYAPANIRLEYKSKVSVTESLTIGMHIMNVFDEDYQIVAMHPMPKRNIAISLKLTI